MFEDPLLKQLDISNYSAFTEEKLAQLMVLLEPLLYPTGLKIIQPYGTPEDIAECISDTLFYIWCNFSEYDPGKSSFKNWCFLIFRGRVINRRNHNIQHYKKYRRLFFAQQSDDAEKIYINHEHYSYLLKEVNKLKQPKKDIFKMRFLDDKTPEEIAQKLNLPVKKIYSYLYEAKKILKECLRDEEKYL